MKMDLNINYKGTGVAMDLAKEHPNSFLYVIETHRINNFAHLFGNVCNRDFDIVQESPGISTQIILNLD